MAYVHEHTGISNIANDNAYEAICDWVGRCISEYCKYNDEDSGDYNEKQYNNDMTYIDNVLAKFAETRDVNELIAAIEQQDTYVRDFYAPIVNDLYSVYYGGEWA